MSTTIKKDQEEYDRYLDELYEIESKYNGLSNEKSCFFPFDDLGVVYPRIESCFSGATEGHKPNLNFSIE